jgi:type VI secretion system protein ImpC
LADNVKPFSFEGINLTAGGDERGAIPSREVPFCVAILGDFKGSGEAGPINDRQAILIDRDNFDEVLAKFAPEIQLPQSGENGPERLEFSDLEDFHPDRVFERAEMFRGLRDLRSRVGNSDVTAAEFSLATAKLSSAEGQALETPTPDPSSITTLATGSLLDESIAQTERMADEGSHRAPDALRAFLTRVTKPHLVATDSSLKSEALATLDRAASTLMRNLMHRRDFQALEAAWRSIFFLVNRIETTPQLKLYLFNISKQELAADLNASENLRLTGLYRSLVERSIGTPGAEPWAVILGNYSFGPSHEDAELLRRIAKIASAADASFVAGASPRLLGCPDFASASDPRDWNLPLDAEDAAAWADLRREPEADAVGLALPRFLLRLPYGEKTAPAESFAFEEMPPIPADEDYLWGNGAVACVFLLAESFRTQGWAMRPGTISEIDGLPLHIYAHDGGFETKPCAEVLLTEDGVERILENGLIPLVSWKGRDFVRLARFQSVASPARGLAGRWNRKEA